MIPTIRDVRGAPVPGLRGTAPHTMPSAVPFRQQLERLLAPQRPAAGAGADGARPVAPTRRLQGPARIPTRVVPGTLHGPPRPRTTNDAPTRTVQRGRGRAADVAARRALQDEIRRASLHAGVTPSLSVAVARAESSLDRRAISPDGISVGAFQVTHVTKREMHRKFAGGIVDRPPGSDDVAMGVAYLRYLHDLFGRDAALGRGLAVRAVGDVDERRLFAVAAYNAGEGRVARAQAHAAAAGGDPTRFADVRPYLPSITQTYVQRVTAYERQEAVQGPILV